MKIVFEKGIKACQMLECLQNFILEQAEQYPILKSDMVVSITLKNDINQINPDNERKFSFSKKDMDAMEEAQRQEAISQANYLFEEEWNFFIRERSGSIIGDIESDKRYLDSAEEMGRSMQNIEKRKKRIEKNNKRLEQEYERLKIISPYVEMYEKGHIDFRYESEIYYDDFLEKWSKKLIKKMEFRNGDIFEYDVNCWGNAHIKSREGKLIVEG